MMNRKQAEHLLDAYVNLENGGGDNDDGYCSCSWISVLGQECMSYEYDSDKDDEEDE